MGNIVTEESIDQQLASFKESGFGGVCIISTYGVNKYESRQITYRSVEWYRLLQHAVQKARKLNMGVDLSLSSAWPFGGPQVTVQTAAKRLKSHKSYILSGAIEKQIIDDPENEFMVSASAFTEAGDYLNLLPYIKKGILKTQMPPGTWNLHVVTGSYTGQMVKRSSPGGEGFVLDHFSKEAVTAYLDDFDKDISGMGGIRSVFNDSYEVYDADYTPAIMEEFEDRRGYSPLPYMHLLLDTSDSEISDRFLCDYRITMAELLNENFLGTWAQWSHKNGFLVTEQAHGSPANIIDLYGSADIAMTESFGPSCFNIPGVRVDPDTKREPYKRPDKLFMKFSSSASNICGNRLTSCETATWLTNHFRTALSQVKPQIDEIFISGINHIQLISATNVPKDAPYPGWVFYPAPDFGPRSALYDYLPDLSGYIARTQHYLQNSTPDNDILVYFPASDYFTEVPKDLGVLGMMNHITTKWGENHPFTKTIRELWMKGFSFDYITDNQILGLEVKDKVIKSKGGARYCAIVIPACKRIPLETMDKFLEIAHQGANIIFDSKVPSDVPGLKDLEQKLNMLNIKSSALLNYSSVSISDNLKKTLLAIGCIKEDFGELGLEFIRKNSPDGKIYFIANLDTIFRRQLVRIGCPSSCMEVIDPVTGKKGFPRIVKQGDKVFADLDIWPGQSIILLTNVKGSAPWTYFGNGKMEQLNSEWGISFEKGEPFTPGSLTTDSLISWTELVKPDEIFYNGTGIYKTTFDRPENITQSSYIRLLPGNIYDMAEVRLNGKIIGRTWSIPYFVDFDSRLLKPKGNTLTINVQNMATNRIIYMDRHNLSWQECYIADPKKNRFNTSDWNVVTSGIVGPVRLIGSDE